jgi:hypothetical protein
MIRLGALRGLASVLLIGGVVGVASAQSAPPGAAEIQGAPEIAVDKMHCTARIDPVKKGESFSAVTEIGCYSTFPEAIAAATGGQVTRPELTPETLTERDVSEAVAIIGIDYDLRNFGGATFTWVTGDLTGCFSPGTLFRANMPASFNNRLTSTRGFSGCRKNDSFPGFNLTGLGVRCFPNCSFVGNFWNNTTSSKRWLR